MADVVTSQIVLDGQKVVVRYTNLSDGTGEAGVAKVDPASFLPTPNRFVIEEVEYATLGMGVEILWDATTPVLATTVPPDRTGCQCFQRFGGLYLPALVAGATGKILFTTKGQGPDATYNIVLTLRKKMAAAP